MLMVLAVVVVRLIRKHQSAAYINTAIGRLAFVVLFSYLVGKTGDQAYLFILVVLGFGEAWTLVALALDLQSGSPRGRIPAPIYTGTNHDYDERRRREKIMASS